jgi:hypothetical protein
MATATSMLEAGIPDEAKVPIGDFRYLELANLSDEASDLTMAVATDKDRFEWANDMNEDAFQVEDWFPDAHFEVPELNNKHLEECTCDWIPVIDAWVQAVIDWPSLCHFYWHFLQADVPGTPEHLNPWFAETNLIMPQLLKINETGLLTLDSQPGVLVDSYDANNPNPVQPIDDDEDNTTLYLQKPYLTIAGPHETIEEILETVCHDPQYQHMRIVSGSYVPFSFKDYPLFKQDSLSYVKVSICVDNHFDKTKGVDRTYLDYVLSNKFFDELVTIVESISA